MTRWLQLTTLLALIAASFMACGPAASTGPTTTGAPQPTGGDPLGERPQLAAPKPYQAPTPQVYETNQGIQVWLLERPNLPMVSMALSVPCGSANDPPASPGMAHITGSMLDEGAGKRGAIAISSAIDDLGASLRTRVSIDGSRVSLTVLQKHLDEAFEIFADVVARPRFDPQEWERVHALWLNQLRKRADHPQAVSRVLTRAVLYGPDTPYGHPTGGQLEVAKAMELLTIQTFYKQHWRPDRALLVVAGAITKTKLDRLIARSWGDWQAPTSAPAAPPQPTPPRHPLPKLVLVDRPEAPQAVITVVGPGVAAKDPAAPLLDLLNTALGGSFTSRLNQNLREDHGWSYGAGSAFIEARGVGPFLTTSAVFTDVTGQAIAEIHAEIRKLAQSGLTEAEHVKFRARDLTELIETHETVQSLVGRLTTLGVLGLPAGFDASASRARQAATPEQLAALARARFDLDRATTIVVGPRAPLLTQLLALDLGEPQIWTPAGRPAPTATPPDPPPTP
ncbi:MAG: insulinase family protein [Deltaproteobacteria bacterium]|nr:insulinase family protein [Deltaproteobacteria bacterium]